MRRFIFLIIISLYFTNIYSQDKEINWIFFVDGKIPNETMLSGEIHFQQDSLTKAVIPFNYTIGKITITNNDFQLLNNKSISNIALTICYSEYLNNSYNKYIYNIIVSKNYLNEPYIVFNITNTNKKKRLFYLEIIGCGFVEKQLCNCRFNKTKPIISEINSNIRHKWIKENLFIMKQGFE